MHLLLVEDHRELALELADYLEGQGHVIDAAADGVTALHLAAVNDYDAIVLDLMLPRLDGLDVCRRLRADAQRWTPVLMLTARDTLEDRLRGFAHGADDYLVKPFSLRELSARLAAITRRGARHAGTLRVADLELDLATVEVRRAGRLIPLTPMSLTLLERLMRASPAVLRRQEAERALWGDEPPDGEALRVHIHSLRAAIDKPFDVALLHTVRGIGYRLAPPDALPT
jgi:DNA-binding response OmpR family regulator